MAYDTMSYWDVYKLPVPIRKWLIQRFNKHTDDQQKKQTPQNQKPMSDQERVKMIANAQDNSLQSSQFMNTVRNT